MSEAPKPESETWIKRTIARPWEGSKFEIRLSNEILVCEKKVDGPLSADDEARAILIQSAPKLLRVCRKIYAETQQPKIGSYMDFENWVEETLEEVLKQIDGKGEQENGKGKPVAADGKRLRQAH